MLLAMFCSSIVLPVRGGATIRPRWPLPIGTIRSMTRADRLSEAVSSLMLLLRVERRQVLEEDLLARPLRRLEVDRLDLDQREVALAFLRRADLARHRVAGVQVELADLRRGDVDVVGAGQVVVVGGAQEAEAVGQRLEHPFGEDQAALLGARSAGSRRSAPACACRSRRARRAAWRSWSARSTLMSLSVESSIRSTPPAGRSAGAVVAGVVAAGAAVVGPAGAACLRHRLLSLAGPVLRSVVHSSSSPSPLVAETGRAAHAKYVFRGRAGCAPVRARDSLSTLVATICRRRRRPSTATGRPRQVGLEPGMPRIDQQQRRAVPARRSGQPRPAK